MALTQMQIIQSLGEAMSWFERELQWGVPPTEQRHLCGRIGELYAALISNGQMALAVNQQGYDVVSGQGERISVKTTAMMDNGGQVLFNPRSLALVDRVMILRINTDAMQVEILLDAPVGEAMDFMGPEVKGKRSLPLRRLTRRVKPRHEIATVNEVTYAGFVIRELESGSIEVERDGQLVPNTYGALKPLALELNVSLLNSKGTATVNTQRLGSLVIKAVGALNGEGGSPHEERYPVQDEINPLRES